MNSNLLIPFPFLGVLLVMIGVHYLEYPYDHITIVIGFSIALTAIMKFLTDSDKELKNTQAQKSNGDQT